MSMSPSSTKAEITAYVGTHSLAPPGCYAGAVQVRSIEKVATVEFDPEGDVIFVLPCTEGTAWLQVNSSVVSLSSPVFRAMLGKNSRFKEARDLATRGAAGPPLEISLADDNPKALATILRIVHLQHEWVPVSLSEDRLYQVAILCDKYDMRRALGAYLEKWLKPYLGEQVGVPGQAADKWLFIAYAFALPTLFTLCSKALIMGICIGESGDPFMPSSSEGLAEAALDEYIPSSVLSEILAIRQQAIEGLVDCAHRYIDKYSDPSKAVCEHKEFGGVCDSTTLGYLIRAFKKARIYPEATELMNMSLGQIRSLILEVSSCSIAGLYSGKVVPGCCSSPSRNLEDCSKCRMFLTPGWDCLSCYCMYLGGSCHNCFQTYKAVALLEDHLSCIPQPGIRAEVDGIVNKITGLQYSDFVRSSSSSSSSNTGNGQALAPHPGAKDLWECLEFR